jgi:hypothetical protein
MLSIHLEYKDEPAHLQIQQSNCPTIRECVQVVPNIISSKLILENVDLPLTLNLFFKTIFEVCSLSHFNHNYLTPLENRTMQFKIIVNAVTLVLFIAGAHANTPDGTYSIINKVPSTSNKAKIRPADRAITFNGKGKPLTVLWDNPDSPEQVYSASIGGLVYLFLTHPSAVVY